MNTSTNSDLTFGILKENIDTDNYNYSPESKLCYFCNGKYDRNYITYLYDLELKCHSCFLCNSVVNFNNLSLGKCFLISSKLNQNEINKQTLTFFNENSILPNIKLLDPNAKIIKMSIYSFIKSFDMMNTNEKKIFSNIKMAFGSEAYSSLGSNSKDYKSYFEDLKDVKDIKTTKKIDNIKYDLSFFELDEYVFTVNQLQILNNKINQLKQSNNNILHIIKTNLTTKQKNTEILTELVDELIKHNK